MSKDSPSPAKEPTPGGKRVKTYGLWAGRHHRPPTVSLCSRAFLSGASFSDLARTRVQGMSQGGPHKSPRPVAGGPALQALPAHMYWPCHTRARMSGLTQAFAVGPDLPTACKVAEWPSIVSMHNPGSTWQLGNQKILRTCIRAVTLSPVGPVCQCWCHLSGSFVGPCF